MYNLCGETIVCNENFSLIRITDQLLTLLISHKNIGKSDNLKGIKKTFARELFRFTAFFIRAFHSATKLVTNFPVGLS
jgi:hypothetical protein